MNENIQLSGLILLVEDNTINQMVVKKMLALSGLEAEVANNGEEAVEKFQRNQYSLILMDCQMPVMDGYEATLKIREYEENNSVVRTPIIALTANVMEQQVEECKTVGMDDFVAKPIKKEQLLGALSRWLPESL